MSNPHAEPGQIIRRGKIMQIGEDRLELLDWHL